MICNCRNIGDCDGSCQCPQPTETCERCQGNGEIVVDWETYLHPPSLAAEEKSVMECPDCNGEGKVVPAPISSGARNP